MSQKRSNPSKEREDDLIEKKTRLSSILDQPFFHLHLSSIKKEQDLELETVQEVELSSMTQEALRAQLDLQLKGEECLEAYATELTINHTFDNVDTEQPVAFNPPVHVDADVEYNHDSAKQEETGGMKTWNTVKDEPSQGTLSHYPPSPVWNDDVCTALKREDTLPSITEPTADNEWRFLWVDHPSTPSHHSLEKLKAFTDIKFPQELVHRVVVDEKMKQNLLPYTSEDLMNNLSHDMLKAQDHQTVWQMERLLAGMSWHYSGHQSVDVDMKSTRTDSLVVKNMYRQFLQFCTHEPNRKNRMFVISHYGEPEINSEEFEYEVISQKGNAPEQKLEEASHDTQREPAVVLFNHFFLHYVVLFISPCKEEALTEYAFPN